MYALIIERLERHVLTERHVAAVMRAAGAKHVDAPTFDREKTRLDRALGADVEGRRVYDQPTTDLIAALGLREG